MERTEQAFGETLVCIIEASHLPLMTQRGLTVNLRNTEEIGRKRWRRGEGAEIRKRGHTNYNRRSTNRKCEPQSSGQYIVNYKQNTY